MKKSLNGAWLFRQLGTDRWKEATVPGCNFLDLMALGEIPDPFYGLNEKDVEWVGKTDWEYKRTFEISAAELESDDVILNCKMLDTLCEVYVNKNLLFSADNCFRAYARSVKSLLSCGENEIRIVFHSPVNFVSDIYERESAPVNSNGQNGIVHIRKPQCHFGWDWGPVLPSSGITRSIDLEFVRRAKIDYLKAEQSHCGGAVSVSVTAEITDFGGEHECEITLVCPDGSEITKSGAKAQFDIENPELWWTYELSGKDVQPLYTVIAAIKADGEILDECKKRIGLRTIELNRERDEYGSNFQFKLNGVPLFIKGANYIPPDSFITRFDSEKLRYFLSAARFSNMNMLRIWGGGYYESDEFYDMCDEMGLLLWQDFQFACQAYPFFKPDFLENVKAEVEYNVKRLCHHASLALWNGNNEIEDMHLAWAHMTKYVDWTEEFFYHILEPEIRKYDTATAYIPGSPCGVSHNNGVSADNVGDTHLWGVWHGLQPMNYYRRRMTRFCSEFGFESLPDMKTIETFAEPRDYSLLGEVFNAHQKCAHGNDKMIYYIASRFDLPRKFRDYIYLSQITQQQCIADATEHWRRNKGRCNGSMYWQFNDCWGVCSWSGIDYYGNYKALQYAARHFNAPLSLSVEDTDEYIKIFALNDLNESRDIEAEYLIFDFERGVLDLSRKKLKIDRVKNEELFCLDAKTIKQKYDKRRTGICARLYENGVLLQQKTVLLDMEKRLRLPKAKLAASANADDSELKIKISADKFARYVRLDSENSTLPLSDNFFDLLPGEQRIITMPRDKKLTAAEQIQKIRVYSLCDIAPDPSMFKEKWMRTRVFLSPMNIANAMYHGKGGTDAKLD